MVRSLLKTKTLLKNFWAEVVTCVVFLLNMCRTRVVFGRTPKEAWSGHNPEVSFL